MIPVTRRTDGACLPVAVQPRARKDEVAGELGGALKVRITAPPVEGAANRHLERVLADALGLARSRVRVVAGEASRHKLVCLLGVEEAEARAFLAKILADVG